MGACCSSRSNIQHKDISLAEFISVAIHLVEESGKIIRELKDWGDISHRKKEEVSKELDTTRARIQKTILSNLHALYPSLQVECGSNTDLIDSQKSPISSDMLHTDFIRQEILNQKHEERKDFLMKRMQPRYKEEGLEINAFSYFNTADAVLWVDPLDGTSAFLSGSKCDVTVIMGLSIKNCSRLGVVHNAFWEQDESKGQTTFGTMEHGVFTFPFDPKASNQELAARSPMYIPPYEEEKPEDDHMLNMAASLKEFGPEMQEAVHNLEPLRLKRMGGAGNKCFYVAAGQVEAFVHLDWGLTYWDLCANEALVKAMGGMVTDLFLEKQKYESGKDTRVRGVIVAKNPQIHALLVKRLGNVLQTAQAKLRSP